MPDFHATVFTDGSCTHHDEVGAWGAFIVTPTKAQLLNGVSFPTTISRCELLPILESLSYISKEIVKPGKGGRIRIISDSEYTIKVISGLTDPHKNSELWEAFNTLAEGYHITPIWRSRNSHTGMELADALAYTARSQFKEYMKKVSSIEPPSYKSLELHRL